MAGLGSGAPTHSSSLLNPAQIVGAIPELGSQLSSEHILDFLTWQVSDARRTFFSGIRRVLPGHYLRIDAESAVESRYWLPAADVDDHTAYPEALEELRVIFRRAVKERLDSRRPLVAHSSGGFDSSTVVAVANRIYREEPGRPPFTMLSGLTPGFACDESAYIENAVASTVSFPSSQLGRRRGDPHEFRVPALTICPVWNRRWTLSQSRSRPGTKCWRAPHGAPRR